MQEEYMYSKYAGAFATPALSDACSQLRTDKWSVCHPTGEKSSAPLCTPDMDAATLQDLYDSHMQCYTYRKLENESHCFSSKDSGHQKAQKVEWKRANVCLDLLKQTVAQSLHRPNENKPKENPIVYENHPSIEQDVEEVEEEPELDVIHEKPKQKKSFWNLVLVIALILFAIFLIFLFLFYVV